MTQKLSPLLYIGGIVLALALMYLFGASYQRAGASVSVSNEYNATTTAASSIYGATVTGSRIIKPGPGALGSMVITGANTGIVNFYDATTSSVLLRAAYMSTSTILIASFPASAAAGTYTLDVNFNNGLYIDLISGAMATSTVTYR